MPLPSSASQQTLQARFGGGNPVGMQQLAQYGQGPPRGMPGPSLGLNGLSGGPGRGSVGSGVALNPGLQGAVRPSGNNPGAAGVGVGSMNAGGPGSNLAALQRGPGGGGVPGGVGLGGFAASSARIGVGLAGGLGGIGGGVGMQGQQPRGGLGNQPAEFSIQTEDFPPISNSLRSSQPDTQQQGQPSSIPNRMAQGQQLRLPGNAGGIPTGITAQNYEQMLRYQQQQQQLRAQLPAKPQQAGGLGALQGGAGPGAAAGAVQQHAAGKLPGVPGAPSPPPDRFGLLGLLSVIRMTDPDLTTLALGTDLTTLGLNLNSPDNLFKTFASPWADGPHKAEPDFKVPPCYLHTPPRLQPGYLSKFQQETLLYIFYSMPGDEVQLFAADELAQRGWWYHKDWKVWLTRMPNVEPLVKGDSRYERGSYMVFNTATWEFERKDNLTVVYDMLERAPNLARTPPSGPHGGAPAQQPAGAAAAAAGQVPAGGAGGPLPAK